jgi:hypothetical protein
MKWWAAEVFQHWLEAKAAVTPSKGLLGKAVNYTLNC